MRYSVVVKSDSDSAALSEQLQEKLAQINFVRDDDAPEIVISIGGDGTLLHAYSKYKSRLKEVAFIGVHTGHLGFYADFRPHELDILIERLKVGDMEVIEYPLLEVDLYFHDGTKDEMLALNEATLRTHDGSTLVADVAIKENHFERFRGDGLCISTPSGSTAYNKSLGGALVHPSINAIQMTEIASINNRVFRTVGSPLILPSHHYVNVSLVNTGHYKVTVDANHFLYDALERVEYRVAKETVRFARLRSLPFWQRVHNSFIAEKL